MNKIAKALLEIKAIFLRPNDFFTFSSGVKSPIYCDNRLVLSYPKQRDLIVNSLVELVNREYPDAQMIMGVSTSGISYGTLIADRLNLPAGYVRSAAKKHGRVNQIEGKLNKGTKVIIVEDLVSTGKSILEAKKALIEAGANVIGSIAIFTYKTPLADKKFNEENLKLKVLTNFDDLIKTAIEHNYISDEDKKIIYEWKDKFYQI